MLSLRLPFQLLTLRPFSSKLPTIERLPAEPENLSASIHDPLSRHRTLRFTAELSSHAYILSILNFMREQPSYENISTRSEQEVRSLSSTARCWDP